MSLITNPSKRVRLNPVQEQNQPTAPKRGSFRVLNRDVADEILTYLDSKTKLEFLKVSKCCYNIAHSLKMSRIFFNEFAQREIKVKDGLFIYNRKGIHPFSRNITFLRFFNADVASSKVLAFQEKILFSENSPFSEDRKKEIMKSLNEKARKALPIAFALESTSDLGFEKNSLSELNNNEIFYLLWSFKELVEECRSPEESGFIYNCIENIQLEAYQKNPFDYTSGQLFDIITDLFKAGKNQMEGMLMLSALQAKVLSDNRQLSNWPYNNFNDFSSTSWLNFLVALENYAINIPESLKNKIDEKCLELGLPSLNAIDLPSLNLNDLRSKDLSSLNLNELLSLVKKTNSIQFKSSIADEIKQRDLTELALDEIMGVITSGSIASDLKEHFIIIFLQKDLSTLGPNCIFNFICDLTDKGIFDRLIERKLRGEVTNRRPVDESDIKVLDDYRSRIAFEEELTNSSM